MGNAILRCFKGGHDDTPPSTAPYRPGIPSRPQFRPSASSGLNSLFVDLINYETNHQVPEGLSEHVAVSKKTQAKWYAQLLAAWKESPPTTSEGASILVARVILVGGDALTGFLEYYSLPFPQQIMELQSGPGPQLSDPSSWPEGVQFELYTLPVATKLVGDGDGMTVHVRTANPREYAIVPVDVQNAAVERSQARAVRDYVRADALYDYINKAECRILDGDILAREYRIRLRGIDAPEMNQEYGEEAKTALRKLIQEKPLNILVYGTDPFGRLVGDVYCNGVFIQEKLLRKGCAWHHIIYDKRPEFAQWQKDARNAGRGLWANPNPVAPWVFKRKGRNKKNGQKPNRNRRNAQRDQAMPIQVY